MGGHSEPKTDAEGLEKIAGWKSAVETKAGATYATFEVVHYTTQVVAGTNWRAKVKVGDSEYIHVTIFEPLPHTGDAATCSDHSAGHTLEAGF